MEGQSTVVTVDFQLTPDGRLTGAPVLVDSQGGASEAAVTSAFEAARRAIMRCGGSGFQLPPEKYEQWREVRMTFNPNLGSIQ
jgi:TonB family protein